MINTIKTEDFRYSVMKNIRGGRNTEENEIHYIGGSEILPAPLSQKEESTVVIDLLNNNSIDARKTLIERNLRLVVYIAKKFDNTGVGTTMTIKREPEGLLLSPSLFIEKSIVPRKLVW